MKNKIKNKNKLLLSVLIAITMFFGLFLIGTDKVLAEDDFIEWEEMTGYNITAYSPATLSADESNNYFSLNWSASNKLYFDTDHVYKVVFTGAPNDTLTLFEDDAATAVATFTSGDTFRIFKRELDGYGIAFHINETAIFEHKGPFVFSNFTELKFYKRPYELAREDLEIEISEFSYEELAVLSSGRTFKHPEFGWITKDDLKIGSEYVIERTDGTAAVFRLLDKSGNKVREGAAEGTGKYVGLIFDFSTILYDGTGTENLSLASAKLPTKFTDYLVYRSNISRGQTKYSSGYIWNLDRSQVEGSTALDFYKNGGKTSLIKGFYWWLGTYTGVSGHRVMYYVHESGTIGSSNYNDTAYYAPAFAFKNLAPKDYYGFYIASDLDFDHLDEYEVNYVNNDSFKLVESTGKGDIDFELDTIYKVVFDGTIDSRLQLLHGSDTISFKNGDLFTVKKSYDDFVIEFDGKDYTLFIDGVGQINHIDYPSNIRFLKLPVAEAAPLILGETEFIIDSEANKPVQYFIDQLTFIDIFDDEITITIEVDNYTPNKRVLNIGHRVVVRATDISGNYTDFEFRVKVYDNTPPVITGNTDVAIVSYKNLFDYNAFKAGLNVSDNHSQLDHSDIQIMVNEYQTMESVLGTYNIHFYVEDESGNGTTFIKQIRVVDDIAPELNGASKITSNINTTVVLSDVKKLLTAYDEIDGNITNLIELLEDNYSGKGNKNGNYTLIYSVTDNGGNTTTKTITMQRVDTIPKDVFVVDGKTINTTTAVKLSQQDIIDILIATGEITVDSTTEVFVMEENYFDNEDQVGQYNMNLETRSTSGIEDQLEIIIKVNDVRNEGIILNPAANWLKTNLPIIIAVLIVVVFGAFIFLKPKAKRKRR